MEHIYDLRQLIRHVRATVDSHELPTRGQYARWIWQDAGNTRDLGVNEYGCADAVNILYTIGQFECDDETRHARIKALRDLQHREDGMYREPTHHTFHCTAHCIAALQLFDVRPELPVTGLHRYLDKDALYDLLNREVDWVEKPWGTSHLGAGVYAALANAGELTPTFTQDYFNWFWDNADPVTGFWRKGYADQAPCTRAHTVDGQASLYQYMAGSFHYLFNHEFAKMPLRYPDRMIDSCIRLYREDGLPKPFATGPDFLEVDLIYCLTRASRQTPHRFDEVRSLLFDLSDRYIANLNAIDPLTNDRFNDLHCLFGMLCALAELQSALPGHFITDVPLRLALDRRPFI